MAINFTPLFTEGCEQVLFVDPSASHMAWCIVTIDLTTKHALVTHAGMIWTRSIWNRGQRFRYMNKCIRYLVGDCIEKPIVGCVTEAFFANPKLMFGSSIVPTVNAFIEMASSKFKAGYMEIGPPAWRSILGIAGVKSLETKKKDFKAPTKAHVEAKLGLLPLKVPSNLDQKLRNTPTDIADCLAIALAYCQHVGISKIALAEAALNPIKQLTKLATLAKTL